MDDALKDGLLLSRHALGAPGGGDYCTRNAQER